MTNYQIVIIPTAAILNREVRLIDESLLMSSNDQLLFEKIIKETYNENNIIVTHILNEYQQSIHYTVYNFLQFGIYDIYFESDGIESINMNNNKLFKIAFRKFSVQRLLN
jgi:hypothetical protein